MKTNHWGIWVDSEKPVTGVFSNNQIEFLSEVIFGYNHIELSFEEYLEEIWPKRPKDQEDFCPDGDSDYLIGFKKTKVEEESFFWFKNRKVGYTVDEKAEYSVIVRETTAQVVRSNWFLRGALCSPCYPGQVDAGSQGGFLAYSLPPDVLGEESKNLKIFKEGREK